VARLEVGRLLLGRLGDMSTSEIGSFWRHPAAGEEGVLVNKGMEGCGWADSGT
jgi:hypothetical protein